MLPKLCRIGPLLLLAACSAGTETGDTDEDRLEAGPPYQEVGGAAAPDRTGDAPQEPNREPATLD